MDLSDSPLERWFTLRPGPYRHFLAGAGPAAWPAAEVTAHLGGTLPLVDWGYGEPAGLPGLRASLAAASGLPDGDHVMLTCGASEANFLAIMASVGRGDEVVVQSPAYPQLACVAAAAGAVVVPWAMPAEGPAVEAEALAHLMTPRTRLVVLNVPHNPTGRLLSRAAWRTIGEAVRSHPRALLLVDEVYMGVGPGEPPPSVLTELGPSRVLVTGSVSKAWGLPGARVGWLLGEPALVAEATRWREHLGLALASPATAWIEALWPSRVAMCEANRELVGANMARVVRWAAAAPFLQVATSPHAAVCLVALRQGGALDDVALAQRLYEEERLLVVPGTTLGYPGAFRVGLGHRDPTALESALDCLGQALGRFVRGA